MYITDALSLSIVPRWVIVPTMRRQSVAEHSFNVAIIVQELFNRYPRLAERSEGEPFIRRFNTIHHALHHDLDECVTGDIPRHAKKMVLRAKRDMVELIPDRPDVGLTINEMEIVKLADIMEAATWLAINGVGLHAAAVSRRLKLDLWAYLDTHNIQEMLGDTLEVRQLYFDIIVEEGRANATGSRT